MFRSAHIQRLDRLYVDMEAGKVATVTSGEEEALAVAAVTVENNSCRGFVSAARAGKSGARPPDEASGNSRWSCSSSRALAFCRRLDCCWPMTLVVKKISKTPVRTHAVGCNQRQETGRPRSNADYTYIGWRHKVKTARLVGFSPSCVRLIPRRNKVTNLECCRIWKYRGWRRLYGIYYMGLYIPISKMHDFQDYQRMGKVSNFTSHLGII